MYRLLQKSPTPHPPPPTRERGEPRDQLSEGGGGGLRERERVKKCTVVPIGFVAQRGRTAYVVSSLGVARRRNLLYLDLRQAAICRYLSDNHCLLHPLQMNNLFGYAIAKQAAFN